MEEAIWMREACFASGFVLVLFRFCAGFVLVLCWLCSGFVLIFVVILLMLWRLMS